MKKIKQNTKNWMCVGVSWAIALAMGTVAFAQEMVKDPSTGKMIKAPQYGGVLAVGDIYGGREPPHTDTWWGGTYRTIVEPGSGEAGHGKLGHRQGQMELWVLPQSNRNCGSSPGGELRETKPADHYLSHP